jgi:hypothetical protein
MAAARSSLHSTFQQVGHIHFDDMEVAMTTRRLWTAAVVLGAAITAPRDARAGIIEFIWEMSGPQMIGVLAECRLNFDGGGVDQCTAAGFPFAGEDTPRPRKLWLTLDAGVYFSTGHDVSGQDYEFGRTWMLSFDPMIEIQTVSRPKFAMYHGVMGVSYNFLFGEGFRKFTNVALKVRPIGVIIANRVNVAYNLRLYPNGFTADQFGRVAA